MEKTIEKHFVTFFSPGTFCPEETTREIDSWDVEQSKVMAGGILERYNATPYGFVFTTRGRGEADLDSKVTAKSNIYYLGGRVETLAEVAARNDPQESVLLCNMRGNGIDKIIVNDNSWRFIGALNEGDVVLDFTPPPKKVNE